MMISRYSKEGEYSNGDYPSVRKFIYKEMESICRQKPDNGMGRGKDENEDDGEDKTSPASHDSHHLKDRILKDFATKSSYDLLLFSLLSLGNSLDIHVSNAQVFKNA